MGKFAKSFAAVAAFGLCVVVFPPTAHAVVNDVTLTGLPPDTTITLTDEKTGQKAEGKSDDRGVVFIPLSGRNWGSGNYKAEARNPAMFPGTPSRTIALKDGSNRVDLTGLVPFTGGYRPRMPDNVVDLHVGFRFFDLAPVGPSLAIRADYTPPVALFEDVFTLRPYVGGWAIPGINVDNHRPYDNGVKQVKVKDGSIYGINAGFKHISDLRHWGVTLPDPNVSLVGMVGFGIGWIHYSFETERVDNLKSNFAEASDHFKTHADGFRMEVNVGVAITRDNYFFGLKGGVAPTITDVLNLDTQLRWEGNLSLVGGFRF